MTSKMDLKKLTIHLLVITKDLLLFLDSQTYLVGLVYFSVAKVSKMLVSEVPVVVE